MHRITRRRSAVLLVGAALLLAVAPAAATPLQGAAAEGEVAPSFFDTLTAWLSGLWPGERPDLSPATRGAATHACGDSAGGVPSGGALRAGDAPSTNPERGSGLDPDG